MIAAAALLAAALAAERAPAAPGEAPRAHARDLLARAERTEVRLGEPFRYEVELRHPADEWIVLAPDLDAPPFRGSGGGCARAPAGEDVRTTCAIRLSLFALGPHDVPELRLRIRTPGGEAAVAVAGPRVTGVGVLAPDAPVEALALRPLAPTVPLRVRSLRVLWLAAGALALGAAALVARRTWRRRGRGALEPPQPEAAATRLLRRLDALEAERLPAREHYFALSAIVREWLGAETGLNALELTTEEVVERLRRAGHPSLDVGAIGSFLARADLVKFAGEGASAGERAAAVTWARGLPATSTSTSTSTPTSTTTPTSTPTASPTPTSTPTPRGRR